MCDAALHFDRNGEGPRHATACEQIYDRTDRRYTGTCATTSHARVPPGVPRGDCSGLLEDLLSPAPQPQQPSSSLSVVNSAVRDALSRANLADVACSSATCQSNWTATHCQQPPVAVRQALLHLQTAVPLSCPTNTAGKHTCDLGHSVSEHPGVRQVYQQHADTFSSSFGICLPCHILCHKPMVKGVHVEQPTFASASASALFARAASLSAAANLGLSSAAPRPPSAAAPPSSCLVASARRACSVAHIQLQQHTLTVSVLQTSLMLQVQ